MNIYLDNCCYNRPFDDHKQASVYWETLAKLRIQDEIRAGTYGLVWSYMNEHENDANPYEDRRESIQLWAAWAKRVCPPSERILTKAGELRQKNIKPKDALHIACAIETGCEYFITTDIPVLKKRLLIDEITVINPIDFVREMEAKDDDSHAV